ncbi:MAG: tRNA uridine-5-carboxymethylaminomethyl(34) synthesis GTPase MnmE, partial [Pseudomonadota bacterium]
MSERRGDTIIALSSAPGRAGVAVFRLSGPAAFEIARRLVRTLPGPRTAALRTVRDADGAPIDTALVLAFPKPRSFTGEDVVEIHAHGSRAVRRPEDRVG